MEAFFRKHEVEHPRLAVGLSQGVAYAALTALIAAVVNTRGNQAGTLGSATIDPTDINSHG